MSRRRMLRSAYFAGVGWLLANRADAANWSTRWQVNSLRFHANFRLSADAEIVQDTLQLQRSIPDELSLMPSDELVLVFVFSNRRTYEHYLKQYFPGVPYRRALFIKQQGPGMVFAFDSDELAVDLRHETTHAVLHTLLPMVPLWLDEGLAEYFEVVDAKRFAGNPHLTQTCRHLRWRRPTSLQQLEQIEKLEQMDTDSYRDAWAWVHFLLHGPAEIRREFQHYLVDIDRQIPPGILSDRLARQTADLTQVYVRHFRTMQRQV